MRVDLFMNLFFINLALIENTKTGRAGGALRNWMTELFLFTFV